MKKIFRYVPLQEKGEVLDVHFNLKTRLTEEKFLEFESPLDKKDKQSPFVQELFKYITGIARIIVYPLKIRIIKGDCYKWEELEGKIQLILNLHFFEPEELSSAEVSAGKAPVAIESTNNSAL